MMHPWKILLAMTLLSALALWFAGPTSGPEGARLLQQTRQALQAEHGDYADIVALELAGAREEGPQLSLRANYRLRFHRDFAAVQQAREAAAAESRHLFARQQVVQQMDALRQRFGEFKTGDTTAGSAEFRFLRTPDGWRQR